jgi:endoglucanase
LIRWNRLITVPAVIAIMVGLLLYPAIGQLSSSSPSADARPLSPGQLLGLLGSNTSMSVSPGATAVTLSGPTSLHPDTTCAAPYGSLTTSGHWIVEAADPSCKIRLAGVSWFGMQSNTYTLAGLNFEPYQTILTEVARMGFNSIRIPFSNYVVEHSASITINHRRYMRANPGLPKAMHPLQLLDDVVQYAATLNIMVILDNHFTKAVPASGTLPPQYQGVRAKKKLYGLAGAPVAVGDEKKWISDWVELANRYISYPNVIGFDLRNEPHTQWNGKWWTLKDYLTNGPTWGRCGPTLCGKLSSTWRKDTDWVTEAENAGNAILAANPHLLIFVEGVQLYPDPSQKIKVDSYWWGGILKGVKVDPVVFNVPHQLVYSTHVWGPWKCCDPDGEFANMSYRSLAANYLSNWAFILNSTNPNIQAPIWIGEFNTCNASMKAEKATGLGWIKPANACVYSTKRRSEGHWFQLFIQYLQNNPELNWSYYPLNGTNENDGQSNNSILGCPRGRGMPKCNPWAQARLPAIVTALQRVESQPTR